MPEPPDFGIGGTILGGKMTTDSTYRRAALAVGVAAPSLRYTGADAELVSDCLRRLNYKTVALTGARATRDTVLAALADPLYTATELDCFIFYFAGHGRQDGRGEEQLLDFANSPETSSAWAIGARELQNLMVEKLRARAIIMILDTCRSRDQGAPGTRGATNGEGSPFPDPRPRNLTGFLTERQASRSQPDLYTILSCSPGQKSYEDDEWQHGIFTKALCDQIRERGRQYPVDLIVKWVGDATAARCRERGWKPEQHPHFVGPAAAALFLPGLGVDEEQQRRFELGRRRAEYADVRGDLLRAINAHQYEQVEALGRRALDFCDDPFERAEIHSFIADAKLVSRPLEDRAAILRDLEAAKSRLDAEKRKREETERESARREDELRTSNRLREKELLRSRGDQAAVDRALSSVNESFRVRDFERAGHFLDQAREASGNDPALLARVSTRQETLATLSKGSTVTREHRGVTYVLVPAGTSAIGPPGASRAVRIPEPFWISRSPISVAAWKSFRPKYTCACPYPDHPAVDIPWALARRYCESVGGRLPTEEEWEYAARGGLEGCDFPWGNDPGCDPG